MFIPSYMNTPSIGTVLLSCVFGAIPYFFVITSLNPSLAHSLHIPDFSSSIFSLKPPESIILHPSFCSVLCDKYGDTKGSLTIGCNCEGAINACESYKNPTRRWTSYDIVCRIKYEISEWKHFRCKFQHVSSHRDDIKKYDDLDKWEKQMWRQIYWRRKHYYRMSQMDALQ